MPFVSRVRSLWRMVFRRARAQEDLDHEVRAYVELLVAEKIGAGMSERDARHAAAMEAGSVESLKDAVRDAWHGAFAETLLQDIRYAIRRVRQRPAFAGAVIGALALGIGASTAMFSAVDAAMLRPLPFQRPTELLTLHRVNVPFDPGPGNQFPQGPFHTLDVTDAAAMPDVFSHVAAYAAGGLNLSDSDRPLRARVGVVTADFFATLGVTPTRGRVFSAEEGAPNGPRVAVLSYALWQRQYGGRAIDGLSVPLNGKSYGVVGVMPPAFSFPDKSDLWIPMTVPSTPATFEAFRGFLSSTVIARVTPGTSPAAASARLMTRWQQSLAAAVATGKYAERTNDAIESVQKTGAASPLQRELVGDRRSALIVLLGATGFLLLIACANVTNLMLSHASVRRREIAVRTVLGATRGRVVRQLLTESVVLAFGGAGLGVLLAAGTLGALRAAMPASLAGIAPAQLDVRVLAFAIVLAMVTGIGFGLWPALGTTHANGGAAIKSGGHGATTAGARRARQALVAAELALSLMLLVGAGLMLRSFQRLMNLDMGMETQRVGTLELAFTQSSGSARRLQTVQAVVARMMTVPGITSAGVINDLPLRGGGGISVMIRDPSPPDKNAFNGARQLMASPGYFTTMGISLLSGHALSDIVDSLAPPVALINATMARTFWPGVDPVGRMFRMTTNASDKGITVIGVVADVREMSLDRTVLPQLYYPLSSYTPANVAVVARGTLAPRVMLARLTEAVRAVDPAQAVFNVRMMDDVVSASVAPRRTNTLLISVFAALALALAALGVYAVVAYGVAQRWREFGIRMALGATSASIVRLVSVEMAWIVLAGLGGGLIGAWLLSHAMTGMLYGVVAHDTATFVIVPVALAAAATLASVVPALRSRHVNPAEVIRSD